MASAAQETEPKQDESHLQLIGVCVDDSEHSSRAFDCEYSLGTVFLLDAVSIVPRPCLFLTPRSFVFTFFQEVPNNYSSKSSSFSRFTFFRTLIFRAITQTFNMQCKTLGHAFVRCNIIELLITVYTKLTH